MGLFSTLWKKWARLPGDQRRYYENHIHWIFLYMIFIPCTMYFFVFKVYDLQTLSRVRATVPSQVNQENFDKWLKEQQAKGRFINDK